MRGSGVHTATSIFGESDSPIVMRSAHAADAGGSCGLYAAGSVCALVVGGRLEYDPFSGPCLDDGDDRFEFVSRAS